MYDMKALYEAYSVEEAVKLRLEHPEAQIIAGGTDVLVQMRSCSMRLLKRSLWTAMSACVSG